MVSRRGRGGVIAGSVLDAGGRPVPDATIAITGEGPRRRDVGALSNDNGEFGFAGLSPGRFVLAIRADGFASQYQPVVVDEDQVSRITVHLRAAR
jgi:protocatechuate 3,4-dioxygenase beta subunit